MPICPYCKEEIECIITEQLATIYHERYPEGDLGQTEYIEVEIVPYEEESGTCPECGKEVSYGYDKNYEFLNKKEYRMKDNERHSKPNGQ